MVDQTPAETYVAITALVLALCSLVVTTGQLLGQYFATAEGLRRCQPSVMGPWAQRTRLRWRWSQFRFEILFTTPEIYLHSFFAVNQHDHGGKCRTMRHALGGSMLEGAKWITGSHDSEINTMVKSPLFPGPSDDHVCWLQLLGHLHQVERQLDQHGVYRSTYGGSHINPRTKVGPALEFRERSWDFMSPDMVRPHASTNVSDLAVLARRLGMIWTDFRPEDGVLRAEGNGHMLTSTVARSVGIVVQYLHSGNRMSLSSSSSSSTFPSIQEKRIPPATKMTSVRTDAMMVPEELHIPVREAHALGFGILLGYDLLDVPDFRIGSIEEVLASMDSLDASGGSSNTIQNVRGLSPRVTFGFSDIIPLALPMLRLRGSGVIRIPIPSEYSVGLTCHTEGFVVFHHRLQEYIQDRNGQVSSQVEWVLEQYEKLKASNEMWEDEVKANERANGRDVAFLDRVHDAWYETSLYFVEVKSGIQGRLSSATTPAGNTAPGMAPPKGTATRRTTTQSSNDQRSTSSSSTTANTTSTTSYLKSSFRSGDPPLKYMDLLASHLTNAVNYWNDAWTRIRAGEDKPQKARNHYGLRNWIAEGMHCYFDYLPLVVKEMRQRGYTGSDELVHEAWFMLIFRAFCWWRCHWMMYGRDMVLPAPLTVPAKYWGSRLPVYIG
ncbi:MAG: hypothetical protein M1823_005237 [Watsoniomyces obsoletus]|nr:MAG: hypothetical protein M1823_005237 [Watsoniomyces obsoletus]